LLYDERNLLIYKTYLRSAPKKLKAQDLEGGLRESEGGVGLAARARPLI
jgi:hypothetical protein